MYNMHVGVFASIILSAGPTLLLTTAHESLYMQLSPTLLSIPFLYVLLHTLESRTQSLV